MSNDIAFCVTILYSSLCSAAQEKTSSVSSQWMGQFLCLSRSHSLSAVFYLEPFCPVRSVTWQRPTALSLWHQADKLTALSKLFLVCCVHNSWCLSFPLIELLMWTMHAVMAGFIQTAVTHTYFVNMILWPLTKISALCFQNASDCHPVIIIVCYSYLLNNHILAFQMMVFLESRGLKVFLVVLY